MNHSRRSILGAAATLLGAGCTGLSGPGTATTTTTTTTTTPTTTSYGAVTVTDLAAQPEVVALDSPDTIGVAGRRIDQYVIATLEAASPAPPVDAFRLETDATTVPPNPDIGGMGGRLWTYGQPYGDDPTGWVAFTLSNPHDTDAATITWPDGSKALPEPLVTTLRQPPTTFTVDAFEAPTSIGVEEAATLSITITNTGDVDGTWIGALNRSGPSVAYIPETALAVDVPAGETRTTTHTNTPDDRYGNGATGEMRFMLDWRGGSLERTVTVGA